MDAQLKRGVLNICILQLLKKKDRYGYDILKRMKEFFPDTEESTIYAILRRLNHDGLTIQYLGTGSANRPTRKYYKISPKGEEALDEYTTSWHSIEKIFYELGVL